MKRQYFLLIISVLLFLFNIYPVKISGMNNELTENPTKSVNDSISGQLYDKLSMLEENATDEIIGYHCKSLKAIFQTEQIVGKIAGGKRLMTLQKTMKNALDWLPKEKFPIEPIISGRNRLIYSFISKRDQTLQPYALRLPNGWKKDKKYPLIVVLHGHTGMNPSPVLFISWEFKTKLGERPPAEYPAYMLEVYGRGNTYYQGIGEVDVFEAMEDVKKRFSVDENRIYLTGQSMGGGGGWNIAARTPDIWAAVSLFCPAFYTKRSPYLPENMEGVPVRFWYGGKDRVKYKNASLESHAYLQKLGFVSEVHTTKEAKHRVPKEQRHESTLWLLKHTRTQPKEFKYIIDTRKHTGRNGVYVTGRGLGEERVEFTCRIDGNKVFIDSKNCTELRIKPKADGLDIQGNSVSIIWNGKEYYNGKIEDVIDLSIIEKKEKL